MFQLNDFKVLKINDKQKKEIIDYGVKMVGAPYEWSETKGAGVKVGIIDTGADLRHEDLRKAIVKQKNFVDPARDATDDNGHGSHVAGIVGARQNGVGVIGVAPESEVYIAKSFTPDGAGDEKAVLHALEWLCAEGVQVINMSFASFRKSDLYERMIKEAYAAGIILICAAGNEGYLQGDSIGYPAKFEECMAVAAVDVNKNNAPYSSKGPKIELSAAGTDVYSCYMNGAYATLSGTSMATPIISGAVAILQGKAKIRYNRFLSPEEIRIVMHMYAEDLGKKGRDSLYGYGLFSFGRVETGGEKIMASNGSYGSRVKAY